MKPGTKAKRWDPTFTSPIVRSWNAEVNRRVAAFYRDARQSVIKDDDYELFDEVKTNAKKYEFLTSAEKLRTFREWIDERLRLHFLDIIPGPSMKIYAGQWWANKYVLSAYKKGMIRAAKEMKAKGFKQFRNLIPAGLPTTIEQWATIALTAPVHLDRVALVFSRTFEDMKGVCDATAKSLSDCLADGMVGGKNPYEMAAEIKKRTDMTATRARMVARTETIRAHHVASINTYREAGLEGVEIVAELATVSRGKGNYEEMNVCPECAALEKKTQENPMPLDEAEGLIPVHPNCRCVAIPRVVSFSRPSK